MMFVDTCFLIDLFRERTSQQKGPAQFKLETLGSTELYISLFSLCELRAGAELSRNPKNELRKIELMLEYITLVFPESSFPIIYGETEALLRKKGTPIPVMDLLIGCTAKLLGMPLLTRDTEHFDKIPGLVVDFY